MNIRVLHLVTSKFGGAGIAAERICDSQESVGMVVTLWDRNTLVANSSQSIRNSFSLKVLSRLLTLVQRRIIQAGSELMTPKSISLLRNLEKKKFDFDVVNIHSFYNLLKIEDLKKLDKLDIPIFITLHDIRLLTGGCHAEINCTRYLTDCTNCPKVRKPFKKMVKRTKFKIKDTLASVKNVHYIVPSKWLGSKLVATYGIDSSKISVIANPVPESFTHVRTNSPIDQLEKKIVIGFTAFDVQSPYKGFKVFMQAIELLPIQVKSQITISIQGHKIPDLDAFKLGEINVICNQYSKMEDFYRNIDCLVVPSYADNYPSVATEAALSGCQLIVSNVGGLPEIAESFGGSIFESGDYRALQTLIMNLYAKFPLKSLVDRTLHSYSTSGAQYSLAYRKAMKNNQ